MGRYCVHGKRGYTKRTGVCRSDKGAAMSKLEEIEKFRNLYPEICEKDGLWQTAPKHYFDDQILIAIRSIDHLLSLVKRYKEGINDIWQYASSELNSHKVNAQEIRIMCRKLLNEPEGGKGLSRPLFF